MISTLLVLLVLFEGSRVLLSLAFDSCSLCNVFSNEASAQCVTHPSACFLLLRLCWFEREKILLPLQHAQPLKLSCIWFVCVRKMFPVSTSPPPTPSREFNVKWNHCSIGEREGIWNQYWLMISKNESLSETRIVNDERKRDWRFTFINGGLTHEEERGEEKEEKKEKALNSSWKVYEDGLLWAEEREVEWSSGWNK